MNSAAQVWLQKQRDIRQCASYKLSDSDQAHLRRLRRLAFPHATGNRSFSSAALSTPAAAATNSSPPLSSKRSYVTVLTPLVLQSQNFPPVPPRPHFRFATAVKRTGRSSSSSPHDDPCRQIRHGGEGCLCSTPSVAATTGIKPSPLPHPIDNEGEEWQMDVDQTLNHHHDLPNDRPPTSARREVQKTGKTDHTIRKTLNEGEREGEGGRHGGMEDVFFLVAEDMARTRVREEEATARVKLMEWWCSECYPCRVALSSRIHHEVR